MRHITTERAICVSSAQVFAYATDYRNVPRYVAGLKIWRPLGAQTSGQGAAFDAEFAAGPYTFRATVRVTEWEESRLMVWTADTDIDQHAVWRFEPDGDGRSHLRVHIAYQPPGGLGGLLVAQMVDPLLRKHLERSVDQLKQQAEEAR